MSTKLFIFINFCFTCDSLRIYPITFCKIEIIDGFCALFSTVAMADGFWFFRFEFPNIAKNLNKVVATGSITG